jgi:hypothetical protein
MLNGSITLGNIVAIITIILGVLRIDSSLRGILHKLEIFTIEHEIILADYCKRAGIDLNELPTRTRMR